MDIFGAKRTSNRLADYRAPKSERLLQSVVGSVQPYPGWEFSLDTSYHVTWGYGPIGPHGSVLPRDAVMRQVWFVITTKKHLSVLFAALCQCSTTSEASSPLRLPSTQVLPVAKLVPGGQKDYLWEMRLQKPEGADWRIYRHARQALPACPLPLCLIVCLFS